jgi:hypothetical protein
MDTTPKWRRYHHLRESTLAAPAVRMVVLMAWAVEEEGITHTGEECAPVVALETRSHDVYTKKAVDLMPPTAPTHETLEAMGWRFDEHELVYGALFLYYGDSEEGVLVSTLEHEYWGASNLVYRLLACPWPPEADEQRLQAARDELKASALARLKTRREPPSASGGIN